MATKSELQRQILATQLRIREERERREELTGLIASSKANTADLLRIFAVGMSGDEPLHELMEIFRLKPTAIRVGARVSPLPVIAGILNEALPGVTTLSFDGCEYFDDGSAQFLASALFHALMSSLAYLHCTGTAVTSRGALSLVDAISALGRPFTFVCDVEVTPDLQNRVDAVSSAPGVEISLSPFRGADPASTAADRQLTYREDRSTAL